MQITVSPELRGRVVERAELRERGLIEPMHSIIASLAAVSSNDVCCDRTIRDRRVLKAQNSGAFCQLCRSSRALRWSHPELSSGWSFDVPSIARFVPSSCASLCRVVVFQSTPRGHVLLRLSLGIGVRLPFAIGDQRAVLLWSNRRGRTSDGGGQTTLPPFTTTDFCARTAVPLLQVQGPSSGFTGVGDFARAADLNHEVRDHAAPQNTNISVPVDIGIRRNGGSRIDQEPGDDDAPGQINGICRYRTRAHEAIATRHATCTSTEPHNAQPLVL